MSFAARARDPPHDHIWTDVWCEKRSNTLIYVCVSNRAQNSLGEAREGGDMHAKGRTHGRGGVGTGMGMGFVCVCVVMVLTLAYESYLVVFDLSDAFVAWRIL